MAKRNDDTGKPWAGKEAGPRACPRWGHRWGVL